jgi:uncharacterized protein with PIN domain
MCPLASFRFYGSLNDFLAPAQKQATLVCAFAERASVKDLVEALGVPHPEIDRIVVNGASVGFGYRVSDGDRVAVYPIWRNVDPGSDGRLSPPPQEHLRFVADVHLGQLAAYLRFAGFDTLYRNDYADADIAAVSALEDRVLLTRDVGVLKRGNVARGYFVRATQPGRQLVEVLRQFDAAARASPFTRCVRCNSRLRPVTRDEVLEFLPPGTRQEHREFSQCPTCARVYWKGSHYSRVRALLDASFAASTRPDPA